MVAIPKAIKLFTSAIIIILGAYSFIPVINYLNFATVSQLQLLYYFAYYSPMEYFIFLMLYSYLPLIAESLHQEAQFAAL